MKSSSGQVWQDGLPLRHPTGPRRGARFRRRRLRAGGGPGSASPAKLDHHLKSRDSQALTLVELILTIVLASLVGIPTGLLIAEHLHIGIRSRDSILATQLARGEMERLDALNDFFHADLGLTCPPGPCPVGSAVTSTLAFFGYPAYGGTRLVECIAGTSCCPCGAGEAVKRITITVTKAGSSSPLARLISFRAKNVSFGS